MRMTEIRGAFAALPLTRDILLGRRALVLSPHPDDEALGAGGLIAQAAAAGNPPLIVHLTDGAASHPGSRTHPPAALAALRENEALHAAAALGVPADHVHFLQQPDAALAGDGPGLAAIVETLIPLALRTGVIISAWGHDPHRDHVAGATIARALAARTGQALVFYPVWGLLRPDDDDLAVGAITGWRLDVAAQLPAKRAAIAAHRSQAGLVIHDAPEGFSLPPALIAACTTETELYLTS